MPKRFISPDWKLLRKLPDHLQRSWFYIWDKADACGVYHYDPEYLKLDLSLDVAPTLAELSTLPNCASLGIDRVLLQDFIQVNYTALKEGYNPHKPAFRDLDKNNLKLNSSLNQACVKLEDEEEDKDVLEGGTGETAIDLTPSVVNEGRKLFNEFWTAYDMDIARTECEHLWFAMSPEERRKAAETVPLYIQSLENRRFQVHPKKWLDEKRWNLKYGDTANGMVKVINCMTGTPTTIPLADWNRVHAHDRNSVYKLAQV